MINFTTPDLCDDFSDSISVVEPGFKNYGGIDRFYGEIVTIKCFEDNSLVREWVARDGDGKILVIDGGGSMRRALLGDLLAGKAVTNNWAGIIVYGCIRDVDAIAEMDVGVQAIGAHPMKTEKKGIGEANIAVRFGGVDFIPGQYLYADNNGVLVSEIALIK